VSPEKPLKKALCINMYPQNQEIVHPISGNGAYFFENRSQLQNQKRVKKTIVYIVFLKNEEKTDCNRIVIAFCNKRPSKTVVSRSARAIVKQAS
jgi:hypothetical protein